jgi:peptidoglycan/LPS O-acetylase OafA/YrhL
MHVAAGRLSLSKKNDMTKQDWFVACATTVMAALAIGWLHYYLVLRPRQDPGAETRFGRLSVATGSFVFGVIVVGAVFKLTNVL